MLSGLLSNTADTSAVRNSYIGMFVGAPRIQLIRDATKTEFVREILRNHGEDFVVVEGSFQLFDMPVDCGASLYPGLGAWLPLYLAPTSKCQRFKALQSAMKPHAHKLRAAMADRSARWSAPAPPPPRAPEPPPPPPPPPPPLLRMHGPIPTVTAHAAGSATATLP